MSSNPTGVKNYQMIRDYLSWIYLYGYFSREDFSRLLPKTTSSFDRNFPYLKDIYPELVDGKFRNKKKYLLLDRATQPSDEDRLANTFFLSTILDDELSDVLKILMELTYHPHSVADITYALNAGELSADGEDGPAREEVEPFSQQTVRNRTADLLRLGYAEKTKYYQVRSGPLKGLSNEDLTDLYRYVKFCGNVTYPRVPARYLLRSIERELLYRGQPLPKASYFRFLNNPNHNVMDEDLVFQLLYAIQMQKRVRFTQIKRGREELRTVVPVCLRIDQRLGRWYLLAMNEAGPAVYRLTHLRTVTVGKDCPREEWDRARAAVKAAFAESRFSGNLTEDGPRTLRMELCFEDPGLERQFLRELQGGSVETENGRRIYRDRINDPIELVPLLRSYSPWLKPETPDGDAESRIRKGLLQMQQQLSREVEL